VQLVPLALQARRGLVEQLARPVQRDLPERLESPVPPALRVRKVLRGLPDRLALRVRRVQLVSRGRQVLQGRVLRVRQAPRVLLGLLDLRDPQVLRGLV
jgi:hypothetical protein